MSFPSRGFNTRSQPDQWGEESQYEPPAGQQDYQEQPEQQERLESPGVADDLNQLYNPYWTQELNAFVCSIPAEFPNYIVDLDPSVGGLLEPSYQVQPYRNAEIEDPNSPQRIPMTMGGDARPVPDQSPARSVTQPTQPPSILYRFLPQDPATPRRKRTSVACHTCRRRKVGCSGERQACQTCLSSGQICEGYPYRESQQSRQQRSSVGHQSARDRHSDVPILDEDRSSTGNVTDFTTPVCEYPPSVGTYLAHSHFRNSDSMIAWPAINHYSTQGAGTSSVDSSLLLDTAKSRDAANSPSTAAPASSSTTFPFYDPTDSRPVHPLVLRLCENFFYYLGCNFPFLHKSRFLRGLEAKEIDGMLVDAVCAVAAQFSPAPLLSRPTSGTVLVKSENEVLRGPGSHPFALRVQAALGATLSRPSIAIVQAYLLFAYHECGRDGFRTSSMYSAMSTQMAQGLGLQMVEQHHLHSRAKLLEERRRTEAERLDTLHCVLFLDRVLSFATGNRAWPRDSEVEVLFPDEPDDEGVDFWSQPFPWLMRVVGLYGRLINVLKDASESTSELEGAQDFMVSLDKRLAEIYQKLLPGLQFEPRNFHRFARADQATNFTLLHLWLHAILILLHQPTLLYPMQAEIPPFSPDSKTAFLSSAKTIVDIVSFAGPLDSRSYIGSPFTAQPIFIAACAFLQEVAWHTTPQSAPVSSPTSVSIAGREQQNVTEAAGSEPPLPMTSPSRLKSRATIAYQHYLRCYQALQSLESYWAAVNYFLKKLDDKAEPFKNFWLVQQEGSLDSEPASRRSDSGRSTPRRFPSHAMALDAVMGPNIGITDAGIGAPQT